MKSISFSIFLIIVLLYMVLKLPYTLGWWDDVMMVIRGTVPILLCIAAFIALVVGIASLKDKKNAKKAMEPLEQKKEN